MTSLLDWVVSLVVEKTPLVVGNTIRMDIFCDTTMLFESCYLVLNDVFQKRGYKVECTHVRHEDPNEFKWLPDEQKAEIALWVDVSTTDRNMLDRFKADKRRAMKERYEWVCLVFLKSWGHEDNVWTTDFDFVDFSIAVHLDYDYKNRRMARDSDLDKKEIGKMLDALLLSNSERINK